MTNSVDAEKSAITHGSIKTTKAVSEVGQLGSGASFVGVDHASNKTVGKEAHILGKKAKEQANDEMGQSLWMVSRSVFICPLLYAVCNLNESVSGGFRDLFLGPVRLEGVGVIECLFEYLKSIGIQKSTEVYPVHLLSCVGEICVNDYGLSV
ncbi:hypothetical protein ES708_21700 [subsurface metagenome]